MTAKLTVIGVYGAYLALVAFIFVFGGKQMMLPSLPAALFAIAAWIGVGIFASQKSTWSLANSPASDLDEREAKERSGAYWSAYAVFVCVVFVGLVGLTMGSDLLRIVAWDVSDISALVWGVFLLGLTLPAAMLMWTGAAESIGDDQ
jgi:hypothetical protein